jgi:hypothetical protein
VGSVQSASINYDGVSLGSAPLAITPDSTHAIVVFDPGYAAFYNHQLRWVNLTANNTPLTARWGAFGALIAGGNSIQYARVKKLPAPWDNLYNLADLNVAAPVSGSAYLADADGITDLTLTAPNPLSGNVNERNGFYLRADPDLSPAIHLYFDGTGAYKLDTINAAGVRTNQQTEAAVIAAGQTQTLRILHWNTYCMGMTWLAGSWTRRGLTFTTIADNVGVGRYIPEIQAGWTMADLRNWPRTSPIYAQTDLTP